MENESANEPRPDIRSVRTVNILLTTIREAGPRGVSLRELTQGVDVIRAKRAELSGIVEPGLPDVEEMHAILDELVNENNVRIKDGRAYSAEHDN